MRRMLKTKLRYAAGKLLLTIAVVGFGLASCTYHTNDYEPVPDNLSFDADIVPIFEASCNASGCHSGAVPPNLEREVAYNELIDGGYITDVSVAENNLLYQKIDIGGSMEQFATDVDRAYIKKWIEEGALNN